MGVDVRVVRKESRHRETVVSMAPDPVGAEGRHFDGLRALAAVCGADRSMTMEFLGD